MTSAPRPLIIGHRGASGYRPEHSRAAYDLALRLGADAVEPDLVASRDGVLVVRHENEISGTTDVGSRPEFADRRRTQLVDGVEHTGWFTEDFTWAELATLRARERLPGIRPTNTTFDGVGPILRLEDLLDLLDDWADAAGRAPTLVAEVKHATHFASIGLPLDELVASALAGRGDLVVESFESTVLGQLKQRGLGARYVYLIDGDGTPADRLARDGGVARPYAADLTDAGLAAHPDDGLDGISVPTSLIADAEGRLSDLPSRARAAGLDLYTWTLRPENPFLPTAFQRPTGDAGWGDWRAWFRLIATSGVDAVFADHPDLVREALGD